MIHRIQSRDTKPVFEDSLTSTSIWTRMLRQVADEITADGDASVAAARTILEEESVRLDTGYSPVQPFRQAIANFLRKSTGIPAELNSSLIIPTSVNVLWEHVTVRLRDKIEAALVSARWYARVEEVEEDKLLTLKFVGAGMLVTALYCIVSLTLCLRRIWKKSQSSRASAAAAQEDQGNKRHTDNSHAVEALVKSVEVLTTETKRLARNQDKQLRRAEHEDFERTQRRFPLGVSLPGQYPWPTQPRAERRAVEHESHPLVHNSAM